MAPVYQLSQKNEDYAILWTNTNLQVGGRIMAEILREIQDTVKKYASIMARVSGVDVEVWMRHCFA